MGRVLNRQLRTVKVTVPLGTAQASPQTTSWSLGPVIVEQLEVMIPRGHSGLTGIHVDYQGVALMPFATPPTFLIASDETITVPVGLEIGAPLSVVTYNLDTFDHAFYLRALVDVFLDGGGDTSSPTYLLDLSAVRG